MKSSIDLLESVLGTEIFRKYVHVLLTDRGNEFPSADAMGTSGDGTRRTSAFFCAPMQARQIEKEKIIPKPYLLKK